jgi:hypothetical protein
MSQVTYGDVKEYVQNRLDLRDEGFITSDELLQYTEEALRYCEAEVHKLNLEDIYFEAEHFISLSSGVQDYALPSNIYGNKILRLVDNRDNGAPHDITRISHRRRFVAAANIDRYGSGTENDFQYRLINNNPTDGTKIRFHPIPTTSTTTVAFTATTAIGSASLTAVSSIVGIEAGMFISGTGIRTGSRVVSASGNTIVMNQSASAAGTAVSLTAVEDHIRAHYIRRVEIPTVAASPIDFPEFWNFIAQHIVVACLKKELGNPRLAVELQYLEQLKEQLHGTLSDMVPDQLGDMVEMDLDHYAESSSGEGI